MTDLQPTDLVQLAARGVAAEEARRQLALLAAPPPPIRLLRPATLGDGIEPVPGPRAEELGRRGQAAAAEGRCESFVPASGAASRMFKELAACLASGRRLERAEVEAAAMRGAGDERALLAFIAGLDRFAFRDELARELAAGGQDLDALARAGPWRPVLEALLSAAGLDYAGRPKGLLPFHRDPDGPRTAFEEHLVEAVDLVRDRSGDCRLHFTVSPEHLRRFESRLGAAAPALERRFGVHYEVGFSTQRAATDTVASLPGGGPFRDDAGRLVIRPAGHGALIENLAERGRAGTGVALVKNIDNVAHQRFRAATAQWGRALLGRLVEARDGIHDILRRIDAGDPTATDAGLALARVLFGSAPPAGTAATDWLRERFDRPLRVCGMVPNTGEPGGGPFWVAGPGGEPSLQIVESVQADLADSGQRAVFAAGTHFNPVLLACSLRDHLGRPFELGRFVDPSAIIVTRKSHQGRELLALERPGLWNGAMAHWNTVFVEVPLASFNPVKTVLDLLRPEHQPD
jgi:hypothetical protein